MVMQAQPGAVARALRLVRPFRRWRRVFGSGDLLGAPLQQLRQV